MIFVADGSRVKDVNPGRFTRTGDVLVLVRIMEPLHSRFAWLDHTNRDGKHLYRHSWLWISGGARAGKSKCKTVLTSFLKILDHLL
jgi:hypothetical protein